MKVMIVLFFACRGILVAGAVKNVIRGHPYDFEDVCLPSLCDGFWDFFFIYYACKYNSNGSFGFAIFLSLSIYRKLPYCTRHPTQMLHPSGALSGRLCARSVERTQRPLHKSPGTTHINSEMSIQRMNRILHLIWSSD